MLSSQGLSQIVEPLSRPRRIFLQLVDLDPSLRLLSSIPGKQVGELPTFLALLAIGKD